MNLGLDKSGWMWYTREEPKTPTGESGSSAEAGLTDGARLAGQAGDRPEETLVAPRRSTEQAGAPPPAGNSSRPSPSGNWLGLAESSGKGGASKSLPAGFDSLTPRHGDVAQWESNRPASGRLRVRPPPTPPHQEAAFSFEEGRPAEIADEVSAARFVGSTVEHSPVEREVTGSTPVRSAMPR